jgi:ribosomal protein L11 methyltransferase
LWSLSVSTSPEAADAVSNWLETRFGTPTANYMPANKREAVTTVYLVDRPSYWSRERAALRACLEHIKSCGLPIGNASIFVRRVPPQDWTESWKRHFRPLEIDQALLIKPSWSARKPRQGQALVVLDPGLSFGTGQHPTTGFCLQHLVAHRRAEEKQSFLDIGTGSGILAIAAAKLGFRPIEALDFDRQAIQTARQNALNNSVLRDIRFRRVDINSCQARGRFGLICANLVSPLLLQAQSRILARLQPRGTIVLAGILKKEFSAIRAAYEGSGLKLISSRSENEWRSGAFQR